MHKAIPNLSRAASALVVAMVVNHWADAADLPENLARTATITASSEYSKDYLAKFVADGHIPGAQSRADVGKAWCAKGRNHPNGVTLTFAWTEPVRVADIVYFGRTAFEWQENWKDYEVYVDGLEKAVASGTLKSGHGPQRIGIPRAYQTKSLTLKLVNSHNGSNPGASEVQIFAQRRPESHFAGFSPASAVRPRTNPTPESRVPDSPRLARMLRGGTLGFSKLVVIERMTIDPSHVYTYHTEGQKPGGGLYVVDITRESPQLTQLVDASDGLVLDANVSYDGRTILFSWKTTMQEKLQLFTINVDGSNLQQLTDHDSNNLNACWLPDDGVAFLSDRKPAFAYCWTSSTPILYRCDRDGGNVIRISANYLNDFTPAVMEDGRIIFSRWEYVDRPAIPIQSLWSVNPDGTCLSGYFGNRVLSPATFMEAHEIAGTGKVLCVLTSHNGPCRGAIGIVDPSKGANAQEAIQNLTPEVDIGFVDKGSGNQVRGPYESPFPVDDQFFLVSRAGVILLRDYAGTGQTTILKNPNGILKNPNGMGYYTARPVMARKRPVLRWLSERRDDDSWASVFVEDVYVGLESFARRGQIKQIAVVQELEKSKFADVSRRAFGFQFPVVSCGATYAPKKVWGFATVEHDGSAHFKVPPQVPIYFMVLDAKGRAIQRMRSFTHLMPGERQSCVGCHANRNYLTPVVSINSVAATRPAQALQEPEWGVEGFSYAHVVQPVLDKHCVECHDAKTPSGNVDLSGDRTDFFNVSYEILARQGRPGENPYTKWIPTFNGQEANILEITPSHWGSPASKLANLILTGHPDETGKPRVDVDLAGQRRVFTWIDLNVPYYGTSESNYYDLTGCRQMLPSGLEDLLKDVTQRRCAACHRGSEGVPREPFLRITNVQNNSFLLAPLARAAGGTQRCGEPVFESKDDPDYQAILKTFDGIGRSLQRTPRMDMVEAIAPECPR